MRRAAEAARYNKRRLINKHRPVPTTGCAFVLTRSGIQIGLRKSRSQGGISFPRRRSGGIRTGAVRNIPYFWSVRWIGRTRRAEEGGKSGDVAKKGRVSIKRRRGTEIRDVQRGLPSSRSFAIPTWKELKCRRNVFTDDSRYSWSSKSTDHKGRWAAFFCGNLESRFSDCFKTVVTWRIFS